MSHRQTASYLTERLAAAGLRPLTRFGQNFLIDLNLIDLIVRTAELTRRDCVLEIGTGVGSLTGRLADAAGAVLTVEVDRNLAALARQELDPRPNVRLIEGDALHNKNTLTPAIGQGIEHALAALGEGARFLLVANLPYNVATPIIGNLLAWDRCPDRMVVTIQKELADRIVALPGSKDYGALSIWVQAACDAEVVRILPPSVFWPRPRVHSAIVRMDLNRAKRQRIVDRDFFHATLRALYCHRRKLLRSVVSSAFAHQLTKQQTDQVLEDAGLTGSERAEQLSVEQTIQLIDRLRQTVGRSEPSAIAGDRPDLLDSGVSEPNTAAGCSPEQSPPGPISGD